MFYRLSCQPCWRRGKPLVSPPDRALGSYHAPHSHRTLRLKRQVTGREVVVVITQGRLDLGPWEQIFTADFDDRRRKRVLLKIAGE